MKILNRKKLDRPIMLGAGDTLRIAYVEIDGVVRHEHETEIATVVPRRRVTADTALLVETEIDGRYAIGGLLVEQDEQDDVGVLPTAAGLAELRQAAIDQIAIKPRHKTQQDLCLSAERKVAAKKARTE